MRREHFQLADTHACSRAETRDRASEEKFTAACIKKVVGVLLMTSLLIIPAAIAQRYARSPEQMAWIASLTGVLAVIGGLLLSWFGNSPIGPSIVLLAGIFFLNALAVDSLKNVSARNA